MRLSNLAWLLAFFLAYSAVYYRIIAHGFREMLAARDNTIYARGYEITELNEEVADLKVKLNRSLGDCVELMNNQTEVEILAEHIKAEADEILSLNKGRNA